ncbi:uncharacterized protein LOC124115392 [Haliotis rufescens]|uniref:uncharacterized protein LOC124115392 n=1 Tax=Haliotis rufescens TaxID=6454 RepID=UPI00201EA9CC|nr:uncharacterized protein LOC124115392 [Haliotis rufescens]
MEGTGCYSGTCYCRPRLLYSPSTGACTLCTTFGTTFSVYPNHGVKSNNDERFYNVDSVEECQKICLEVKGNTCRSAEYTKQKTVTYMFLKRQKPCYISFASMEDMRKGDLIGADNGWTLSLRDCE